MLDFRTLSRKLIFAVVSKGSLKKPKLQDGIWTLSMTWAPVINMQLAPVINVQLAPVINMQLTPVINRQLAPVINTQFQFTKNLLCGFASEQAKQYSPQPIYKTAAS